MLQPITVSRLFQVPNYEKAASLDNLTHDFKLQVEAADLPSDLDISYDAIVAPAGAALTAKGPKSSASTTDRTLNGANAAAVANLFSFADSTGSAKLPANVSVAPNGNITATNSVAANTGSVDYTIIATVKDFIYKGKTKEVTVKINFYTPFTVTYSGDYDKGGSAAGTNILASGNGTSFANRYKLVALSSTAGSADADIDFGPTFTPTTVGTNFDVAVFSGATNASDGTALTASTNAINGVTWHLSGADKGKFKGGPVTGSVTQTVYRIELTGTSGVHDGAKATVWVEVN